MDGVGGRSTSSWTLGLSYSITSILYLPVMDPASKGPALLFAGRGKCLGSGLLALLDPMVEVSDCCLDRILFTN